MHVEKLVLLVSAERVRVSDPEGYKDIIEKWHFTVTQAHELKKLIRRWLILIPSIDLMDRIRELKNSRQVIGYLKKNVNKFEIDWK